MAHHRGMPALATRVGILVGLSGLGAGVATMLTGVETLGLAAGVLALVGPALMLRADPATAAEPVVATDDPPRAGTGATDAGTVGGSTLRPFHQDSELLTADYFEVAVEHRLRAARRFLKPLSIVRLQVTSEIDVGQVDAVTTTAVGDTLRDCDTAYVMAPGEVALVLEDTPESGAVWAAERLRRHLTELDGSIRMWAGIACYPAHAMDTDEVIARSEEALTRARDWPQERIEVAAAD